MAIALLLKPKYRTTVTAEIIQTYEVVLCSEGQDAMTGQIMSPRPAMGFEPDDAVYKLVAMLKSARLTVDEFLGQLPGYHLALRFQVIGNTPDIGEGLGLRRAMPKTHDAIVALMRSSYNDVNPTELTGVEQRLKAAEVDPDGGGRMDTFTNSANQQAAAAPTRRSPLDKLPKERRIITVNQGGGSDQREAMAELAAQLTPESIPSGGLVITMGKNGPKILKAASARIDEEETAADVATLESGGEVNTHARSQAAGEITINRDPKAGMPVPKTATEAPRPAPQVRTMTEEQLATQAQSVDITHRATVLDQSGFETSMGTEDAAALADEQMGTAGMNVGPVDMKAAVSATVRDADHHTQLGEEVEVGGRAVKKSTVVRHDRGGTRPKNLSK